MKNIQGLAAALLLGAAPTFALAQVDLPPGATAGRSESPNQQQGQGTNQNRSDATAQGRTNEQGRAGQAGQAGRAGQQGQPGQGGAAAAGQFDDQLFLAAAREAGQAEILLSQLAAERASSDEVKQYARQMIEDHEAVNQKLMSGGGAGGLGRDPNARPGAPGATPGTDRGEPGTRPDNERADARSDGGRTAGDDPAGAQAARTGTTAQGGRTDAALESRQAARPAFDAQGQQGGLSAGHRAAYAILASKQGEEFDKCYIEGQVAAHICAVGLFKAESEMGQEYKQLAAETLPKLEQHLQMAKQMMTQGESSTSGRRPEGARPEGATGTRPE